MHQTAITNIEYLKSAGAGSATTIVGASAISAKYTATTTTNAIKIGNVYYKVSTSGSKLTIEYKGVKASSANTIVADASGGKFTSSMATLRFPARAVL